jgi:hypothetical protein
MVNRIVYLRWGERYTQDHVDALHEQVKANCSVPFEFHTFDCHVGQAFDQLEQCQIKHFRGIGDPESSITENPLSPMVREDEGGMAHFRKYIMFMRDQSCDPEDKILYLDLDTIIKGDLAYFFDLDMSKPWIFRSWQFNAQMMWKRLYPLRSCPYFNSSVMLWKPNQCRKVFDELMRAPDIAIHNYGVNDNWLFHRFGPHAYTEDHRDFFNFFDKHKVVSDSKYLTNDTIIHTLAGMTMNEKNELCLQ